MYYHYLVRVQEPQSDCWPCKIHVSSKVFAPHSDVSTAVCFAYYTCDLGHRCFAIRVKQLTPMTNYTVVFLIRSWQVTRGIYQGNYGNVVAITKPNEPRFCWKNVYPKVQQDTKAGWRQFPQISSILAKPTRMFSAKSSCISKKSPSSTIDLTICFISYCSYGF